MFEKYRRLSKIITKQILAVCRKNNSSSVQPNVNGACVVECGEVAELSVKLFF